MSRGGYAPVGFGPPSQLRVNEIRDQEIALLEVIRPSVVNWRRRLPDFPASVLLAGTGGATHRLRLDDPWLTLAKRLAR